MEESNIMFKDLGLSDAMLKALEKKGYGYPTTIQQEAIPCFMQWKDVIAKAPTGTGKTFAFGIPMIEHIDPECDAIQGLILAPTRELYANPQHPYTKALLSAIPIPDPIAERNRKRMEFNESDFHSDGVFTEVSPGHFVLQKEGTV